MKQPIPQSLGQRDVEKRDGERSKSSFDSAQDVICHLLHYTLTSSLCSSDLREVDSHCQLDWCKAECICYIFTQFHSRQLFPLTATDSAANQSDWQRLQPINVMALYCQINSPAHHSDSQGLVLMLFYVFILEQILNRNCIKIKYYKIIFHNSFIYNLMYL